jgi:ELWxxDGT repeat protein
MCRLSLPLRMNKAHALLFALMMMTVSLAGCFGGDVGEQGPAGSDGVNGIDGQDGINGTNGTNGISGTDALNALVISTSEPSGNNCANGGIRVDIGVDDSADGVLDPTEVNQTQYVCDSGSSNNTMLTSVTSVVSNGKCDAGGRTVSHGLDNGDNGGIYANGVLESGEIDASTMFCSHWIPGVVKDINNGIGGSNPSLWTSAVVGNTVYFNAYDETHGWGLWKSDGTASGTVLVKDINNGYSDSHTPYYFTAIGTTIYFSADDGLNGRELWKSDGTASGTIMIKDICNGGNSSSPRSFTVFGDTLYFNANDGLNGWELWKSDGTANGTMMVKDIYSGGEYSYGVTSISSFAVIGTNLYFRANDGTNGSELWKSDGTANGTIMVKDINSGSGYSSPSYFVIVGDTFYFVADDGLTGRELWKSDGTANGTVMVKDINEGSTGSSISQYTLVGNNLFFKADDGINGTELWKSDGTANGTIMVKDINHGPLSSISYSGGSLTVLGNTLYFIADDGTNGTELWKSDGTASGTMMVKDINNGSLSGLCSDSCPAFKSLKAIGSTLYFSADDGTYGFELWKSDGTANSTMMVHDMNSGTSSSNPSGFISLNNNIVFIATHETRGAELFIYHYEVDQVITYS